MGSTRYAIHAMRGFSTSGQKINVQVHFLLIYKPLPSSTEAKLQGILLLLQIIFQDIIIFSKIENIMVII